MDTAGSKRALRRALRAARRGFVAATPADVRATLAIAAAQRVLDHLGDVRALSAFLPLPEEIDPGFLLAEAERRGIATALPHVTAIGEPMRFVAWTHGTPLLPGPFGLVQPSAGSEQITPDTILTPLLGFDRRGHRIGQGGGFYDRAFAAYPRARRIGFAWSVQEHDAIPLDPWDVPLHAIATEREWIVP